MKKIIKLRKRKDQFIKILLFIISVTFPTKSYSKKDPFDYLDKVFFIYLEQIKSSLQDKINQSKNISKYNLNLSNIILELSNDKNENKTNIFEKKSPIEVIKKESDFEKKSKEQLNKELEFLTKILSKKIVTNINPLDDVKNLNLLIFYTYKLMHYDHTQLSGDLLLPNLNKSIKKIEKELPLLIDQILTKFQFESVNNKDLGNTPAKKLTNSQANSTQPRQYPKRTVSLKKLAL